MDLDKLREQALKLLDERDLALNVSYVREDKGRVYFEFQGEYVSQDGERVGFDKKFATEVICSLYDDGYLELTDGRFPSLRDVMAKLAETGKQELSAFRITAKGEQYLDSLH